MPDADDVEAFRDDAAGSIDGAPLPSPGGSRGVGAAAAPGFGRRSGLSGGSGSLLAHALAGLSPKCVAARCVCAGTPAVRCCRAQAC
jgi:hypothetical protein